MSPTGNFFAGSNRSNSISSEPDRAPVVILGAGLTGLCAAYHLQAAPFLLVEQHSQVGGHARSHREQGHTFDVTGHWLHLRDDRSKALLAELFPSEPGQGSAWVSVERKTKIHSHGAELEYPFQANLHGLPLDVVQECLVALVEAREAAARGEAWATDPRSFEAYAIAKFGRGIARHFFVPYNTKLWGMHPDRLAPEWVRRFVPEPDAAQIIAGAIGLPQTGLGYNVNFMYPRAGGIDALPNALRGRIQARERAGEGQLRTQTQVEEIEPSTGRVKLSSAPDWIDYRALISSIPLPELIARIPEAPPEVREAAAALRWVRWRYLDVATTRPIPADWHWVYVPELRFDFFRVGAYSNAVASMAPPDAASLYVELSEREREPDLAQVAQQLVEIGALASVEHIRFARTRDVEYAYVVFDEDHGPATATISAWLERVGIRSCGRYGAWIYNSMEDSMLSGLAAAQWADGHTRAAAATEAVARREGTRT
ncbi:protoporphyrinogen/coproporphyrinogen oxidase [Enhygromyxa salina]|uniref:dTDP-fucopyranose mutase n=1 Tax=Enhygromyxa salina TaxID=215803 RepID=A0A2S9XT28_9BACT|nr:NAD(P)-binding protein [Enhygromyxa salina]PRP96022.1 dTDP-fucopyranose mutase [Enhygromyxa salina]